MLPLRTRSFRFGIAPSLGLHRAQTLARRIESALAPSLGTQVEVRVAGSLEHLEAMLLGGALDAAWVNALLIAHLHAAGTKSVLRGVRHGSDTFCSALVVRRDDELSLESLPRLRVAWTDPDSVAGYLLPQRFLLRRGLEPKRLFVEERFSGSYPAALGRLLEGRVDLAPCFVHRADPEALQRVLRMLLGGGAAEGLRPLGFTDAVPNDGLVLAPHFEARDGELLAAIEAALSSPEGRSVLDALDVDRLVRSDAEAYASLRAQGP